MLQCYSVLSLLQDLQGAQASALGLTELNQENVNIKPLNDVGLKYVFSCHG
jgi:hypothetical protein